MDADLLKTIELVVLQDQRVSPDDLKRIRDAATSGPVAEQRLAERVLAFVDGAQPTAMAETAALLDDRSDAAVSPLVVLELILHGQHLHKAQRYADAVAWLHRVLAHHLPLSDAYRAEIHSICGSSHLKEFQYADAFREFTESHAVASRAGLTRLAARMETDLANVAIASGDLIKAVSWLQQALLKLDTLEDSDEESAKARINLASLFIRLGRNDNARREYELMRTDPTVRNRIDYLLPVELNLAITYKRMELHDHSLDAYLRVLALARENDIPVFITRAHIGIADHHVITGDLDAVHAEILQAADLAERYDFHDLLLEINAHRANIAHQQGNGPQAIELLTACYHQARDSGDITTAMLWGLDVAGWLAETGDHAAAYRVLHECHVLQQKISENELERTLELNDLRTKLDQERELIRSRDEERNRVLHSVMPTQIAQRLMAGEDRIADMIPSATILFADVVGFTHLASRTPADRVVLLLEDLFTAIDALGRRHGCQRVKTIGDAYMAICGTGESYPDHAARVVRMALDLLETSDGPFADVKLRIGINTGPVIAGVMRGERIAYDVWGDTVNVASRMEEHSAPGAVLVSSAVAEAVQDERGVILEQREPLDIRGKGLMTTFWVRRSS